MKKKHISTILLILVFLAGLALLLYPTVGNLRNEYHAKRAVQAYSKSLDTMSEEDVRRYLDEAEAYNVSLPAMQDRYRMADEALETYMHTLDPDDSGMMGYIEIPTLHVRLPICHTVEDTVLQTAVGHMPGSSLPVGGEGTHCILSGHRGLPSAKLFTDLDKLSEGDLFTIHVLNTALTYEVDQIRVVEPYELEQLAIVPGKDYCTLVTCTPYGINTHRLLVRGTRIIREEDNVLRVTAEAARVDGVLIGVIFAVLLVLALTAAVLLRRK